LKVFERRQQRPPAARIAGGQFTFIEAGMGDIATAAAGNADFGEELRSAFEHRHLGLGRGLGTGDGSKKTRRAAADHNDPLRTHAREFNRVSRQCLSKPCGHAKAHPHTAPVWSSVPPGGTARGIHLPLPRKRGTPNETPVGFGAAREWPA
jgi:hypothetical protein